MKTTIAVLIAVALLSAACGGGDDADDDGANGSTPASSADGETTAPADPTSSSVARVNGGSASPATTAKPGAGSSGRSSTRVGAASGTYKYSRKGTSSVSGGYTASKPVDVKCDAKVEPATGQEQRTTFIGSCAEKETITRFSDAGAEYTFLKVNYGNKEASFKPSPPAVVVPKPATPGRTWTWSMTSTDGSINVTAQGKVVRTERISAGGESVDTVVYELAVNTKTPDLTRTENRTVWWSDKHGLMVKQHDVTDSDQAGFHVHTDTTTTIESLEP